MNYNFEHGLVGMYRGTNIYVVSSAEFAELIKKGLIGKFYYAITESAYANLALYRGKQYVGCLTPEGDIILDAVLVDEAAPVAKEPKETQAAPAANDVSDVNLDALGFQVDDYLKQINSQTIYKDLMRDFDN